MGIFTDAATQVVVNRLFPKVPYEVFRSGKELLIRTDSLELFYDEKPFSRGCTRYTKKQPVSSSLPNRTEKQ